MALAHLASLDMSAVDKEEPSSGEEEKEREKESQQTVSATGGSDTATFHILAFFYPTDICAPDRHCLLFRICFFVCFQIYGEKANFSGNSVLLQTVWQEVLIWAVTTETKTRPTKERKTKENDKRTAC